MARRHGDPLLIRGGSAEGGKLATGEDALVVSLYEDDEMALVLMRCCSTPSHKVQLTTAPGNQSDREWTSSRPMNSTHLTQ
jgi:hypothetical protein